MRVANTKSRNVFLNSILQSLRWPAHVCSLYVFLNPCTKHHIYWCKKCLKVTYYKVFVCTITNDCLSVKLYKQISCYKIGVLSELEELF